MKTLGKLRFSSRALTLALALLAFLLLTVLFVFLDPLNDRRVEIRLATIERDAGANSGIRLEGGHWISRESLESLGGPWRLRKAPDSGVQDAMAVGVVWEGDELKRLKVAWPVLYPEVSSRLNPFLRYVFIGATDGVLHIYRRNDFEMWRTLKRIEPYHCSYFYVISRSDRRIEAIRQRPEPKQGTRAFEDKDFILKAARVEWSSEHRKTCRELLEKRRRNE